MAWLDALRQRLSEALRPNRADRDLEDELRDHLDREVARQAREGMTADDARRQARLRSGNLRSAREAAQDRRTGRIVADAASDLRIGLRGLQRTPGFAAAVIVSL